jgi:hypothetical protein
MTTELQDILDVVNRLNSVRSQPPIPLTSHLSDRPRDGPSGCPDPFRPIERATGQIRPSQRISTFDYYSRGKS